MRLFFYFPVFLMVFTAIGYFFPTGLSAQTPDRAPLDPAEVPTAEVIPEPVPRPAKPTRSHGEVIDPGVIVPSGPQEPIQIKEYSVRVEHRGRICRTVTTITFKNPNDTDMEETLEFPLPEGVTVSGYALDINGVMVDASAVTKEKARVALESEIRRNVDPALVEVQRGNQFKTRIYPVPAFGKRTIRIEFVSVLEPGEKPGEGIWRLPLTLKKPAGYFEFIWRSFLPESPEVMEKADQDAALSEELVQKYAPRKLAGEISELTFEPWEGSLLGDADALNFQTQQEIVLAVPLAGPEIWTEKSADGFTYYAAAMTDAPKTPEISAGKVAADPADAASGTPAPLPKSVTVFWDCSGSRSTTGFAGSQKKELAFLQAWLQETKIDAVRLVPVRNSIEPEEIRTVKAAELEKTLTSLPCDGATDLSQLAEFAPEGMDSVSFLFSDGFSNWHETETAALPGRLFTFASGSAQDTVTLKRLAQNHAGDFLNLEKLSVDQAVRQVMRTLQNEAPRPVQVSDGEIFPKFMVSGNSEENHVPTLFVGRTRSANVEIQIGEETRTAVSCENAPAGESLRTLFGQRKLEALLLMPGVDREAVKDLGHEFSLATPETSLIVLESLEQYLQHDIAPPESLIEMRQEFFRIRAQQNDEIRKSFEERKADRIQYVEDLWSEYKEWRGKNFQIQKFLRWFQNDPEEDDEEFRAGGRRSVPEQDIAPAMAPPTADEDLAVSDEEVLEDECEEEVSEDAAPAPGMAVSENDSPADTEVSRTASVEIQPWNPDSPYLKRMAEAQDPYAVYLAQRGEFAQSPAFFLECAEFFRERKNAKLALRVLSNLAEMELENQELLRVLGNRLLQYENPEDAVPVFRKVLEIRPEEPQSYRDLAIALTRRAEKYPENAKSDFTEALQHYATLIYGRDFNDWESRFPKIELFGLEEANALIPLARKAGVTEIPLSEKLIGSVDMDIRIVLTWSGNDTDIDLWVTEPGGEKVGYSHPASANGGQISADFTSGYGPEEYRIRRALKGKYEILAHFYSSSSAKILGAVTIQADVFTNFARKNQKRESLTFQLKLDPDSADEREKYTIGTIEFKK